MPSLAPCRTCGDPVSSEAAACPHCGDMDPHAPRRRGESGASLASPVRTDTAVKAGWICLGLYIAAAWLLPFLGPLLVSPLVLAGFVLGIVGASRGAGLSSVALIVVSCITGLAGCVTSCGSVLTSGY